MSDARRRKTETEERSRRTEHESRNAENGGFRCSELPEAILYLV